MKNQKFPLPKIKVPNFTKDGFKTTNTHSDIKKKVKGKNTKIELLLRKALWKEGLRYRLHSNKIEGKPDIIFASMRIVIFVDGDFWHGYNWENQKKTIKSNKSYWIPKIERNIQRDLEIKTKLQKAGWIVIRIWEHQIRTDLPYCVKKIKDIYKGSHSKACSLQG